MALLDGATLLSYVVCILSAYWGHQKNIKTWLCTGKYSVPCLVTEHVCLFFKVCYLKMQSITNFYSVLVKGAVSY